MARTIFVIAAPLRGKARRPTFTRTDSRPEVLMSNLSLPAAVAPVVLLTISNVFMTFAWYGHLNHKSWPLWFAVIVSWGIAFVEYCFAVPANRLGHAVYSAA